jgi:predicted alpha/beta hydrolase
VKYDLQGIINWGELKIGYNDIYLLGHSIGGQLFGFLNNYKSVKRLITIASQKSCWRLWPNHMQLIMLATWNFFQFYLLFFNTLTFMSLLKSSPLSKSTAFEWCRWALSE